MLIFPPKPTRILTLAAVLLPIVSLLRAFKFDPKQKLRSFNIGIQNMNLPQC